MLSNILTLNLAAGPLIALDTHLDGCETPVLAVVVALAVDAGAGESLLVVEHRQDAKDDGDAGVELHAHEAVRGRVGNVLKVHRLALDKHADSDDGVKSRRCRRRGEVGRRGGEEVAGGGAARRRGLDLGGGVKAVFLVYGRRSALRDDMGGGASREKETDR